MSTEATEPGPAAPAAEVPATSSHLERLLGRRRRLFGLLKTRRRRLAALTVVLGLVFWFVPPVYKLVYGPVTVTRWDRQAGETRATVGPGQKGWIPTRKISKHALHAIISAEDGRFYDHYGLDFGEIASSVKTNLKRGKFARGGSTISQQVVKMAFLGREKTLIRKAREAVGTVLMETILSKDKILEWYINLAEFGDGVYGVEEGCWHYFKTKPEYLSIEQAVHLALVLPSPNNWSRGLRARHLTQFGHRRFAAILNRMRQSGYITKAQWASAVTRGDFGRPIAGYSRLLAQDEQKKTLCPGNPGCPDGDDEAFDEDQPEMTFPESPPPQPTVPDSPVDASPSPAAPVDAAPAEPVLPEAPVEAEPANPL